MSDIQYLPRPRRYVCAFMASLIRAVRGEASDLYLMELVSVVSLDSMGRQGEN